MKEKKGEEGIKIEVSQEEPNTKDKEKEPETKEKPLAKMTKSELLEKIKELKEESTKNFDLYLRSQADIENIKKRNKKDKDDWIRYSNETLIKEMLPVIDNLEKAISHSQNENSFDALKEGVKLTLKGFIDTLVKSGLEEVKAQGEPFDRHVHVGEGACAGREFGPLPAVCLCADRQRSGQVHGAVSRDGSDGVSARLL